MEVHMFRASVWTAIVLGLSVSGCERYATVDAENVGTEYVTGGGEWNTGGGVTVVARVFERNGATVVCGAWTTDRQSVLTINLNYNVMEIGSVYLGRTRVVQNLGFMARVPYSDNITGAQANCVASSRPWRPEFAETEPRLRFPRVAYLADGGDKLAAGGGGSVVFRETARPQIIR
jgi:hypothetical protein